MKKRLPGSPKPLEFLGFLDKVSVAAIGVVSAQLNAPSPTPSTRRTGGISSTQWGGVRNEECDIRIFTIIGRLALSVRAIQMEGIGRFCRPSRAQAACQDESWRNTCGERRNLVRDRIAVWRERKASWKAGRGRQHPSGFLPISNSDQPRRTLIRVLPRLKESLSFCSQL